MEREERREGTPGVNDLHRHPPGVDALRRHPPVVLSDCVRGRWLPGEPVNHRGDHTSLTDVVLSLFVMPGSGPEWVAG